jgi:hypothetical protein
MNFREKNQHLSLTEPILLKKIPSNLYIKVGDKGNCKHELILGGII